MSIEFEWDEKKAATNERKHGVFFSEAATVFNDPLAITFPDPDHSKNEDRFLTFGLSQSEKLLVVGYTERNLIVRCINARLMTKRERRIYEEN